jgi:hypothetical protein
MVPSLPADRSKWLLEPKLDGYRVIAVKAGGNANLYSMDSKIYNQGVSRDLSGFGKALTQERGIRWRNRCRGTER